MGHYCIVCARSRPNEKFSGKGHRNHVCKDCSKKPVAERNEMIALNKIYGLYRYMNLSKNNRRMLEGYLKSDSEKVRDAAKAVLYDFTSIKKIKKADEYDLINSMETDISGKYEYDSKWHAEICPEKITDPGDDEELPF